MLELFKRHCPELALGSAKREVTVREALSPTAVAPVRTGNGSTSSGGASTAAKTGSGSRWTPSAAARR